MKTALIVFQLAAATVTAPGQIDSVCRGFCATLAVQDGAVRLVDLMPPTRNLVVGNYIRADQHLVPATEAPVRDLRSPRGWRVIVSAFLDHEDVAVRLRLRFFDPSGALREQGDLLSALVSAQIGTLFDGDEIFGVTSMEEHAYNDQLEIWLLPESGKPRLLLELPGSFRAIVGSALGVTVERETYDGVNAETKGRVQEFWAWDPKTKALIRRGR
jgi:hypothetical protein